MLWNILHVTAPKHQLHTGEPIWSTR